MYIYIYVVSYLALWLQQTNKLYLLTYVLIYLLTYCVAPAGRCEFDRILNLWRFPHQHAFTEQRKYVAVNSRFFACQIVH